jgi:hypothetical protein
VNTNFFLRSFIAAVIVATATLGGTISSRGATAQTIAWTGATNEFLALNVPYPLGATASSGLPVTLQVQNGPAVITNGTITVTAPGTVWVKAVQAGNADYGGFVKVRAFNLRQAALSLVGQYSGGGSILDLAVKGSFLYAASEDKGVQIFDVTDPASPRLVGQYPAPSDSRKIYASKISIAGNLAYVANRSGSNFVTGISTGGSLDILDIRDPAKPALMGSISLYTGRPALQVAGSLVYYLVDRDLFTIDVSNPSAPTISNEFRPDLRVTAHQIAGSLMYLFATDSEGQESLYIFDISAPPTVREIARSHTVIAGDDAIDLRVSGSSVYLLGATELIVFQGTPTNLVRTGSAPYGGTGLDVSGDYVFVPIGVVGQGAPPGGVVVLDVSNPARIIEVGGYRSQASGFKALPSSDITYLAGNNAPLKILRTTFREPPKPILEFIWQAPGRPQGWSVLLAPSIPLWQVQVFFGLGEDPLGIDLDRWDDAQFLQNGGGSVPGEEADGFKKFYLQTAYGGDAGFYLMRKTGD